MTEIPLQIDLFSGEKVDTRTNHQKHFDMLRELERTFPQQTAMFSQREVAQFGVTARPVMSLSPGKLNLLVVDPRSPEEIEHDLLEEAKRMTIPSFPSETPDMFACTKTPLIEVQDVNTAVAPPFEPIASALPMVQEPDTLHPIIDQTVIVEVIPSIAESPLVSPVMVATPDSSLLLDDPGFQSVETTQLENDDDEDGVTPLVSSSPRLSKYAAYKQLVVVAEERAATLFASPGMMVSETIRMSSVKFDARVAGLTSEEMALALKIGEFRGKSAVQKTQSEKAIAPDVASQDRDIPILWVNRDDMLKRRPDLADTINSLRDDEFADLGGLIGQALEEFYWIQLNVVLSLFLDHDLRLYRATRKIERAEKEADKHVDITPEKGDQSATQV